MSSPIAEQLIAFVRQAFGSPCPSDPPLGPATPLFSSRLIDSMGLVELTAFVERTFGVPLDLTVEELTTLDTAERLADFIARQPRRRP